MTETNAFNAPAATMAAASGPQGRAPAKTKPAQPPHPPSSPRPAGASKKSATPSPRVNPNTAASGVPKATGRSERQLDGNRSTTFSPPVKKGGLAERGPSAARSSSDRVSGLESAMHAAADQHHPRTRPKVTRR